MKIKVAVVGATGIAGQQVLAGLDNHPTFEVAALAASERSAGKSYADAIIDRESGIKRWYVAGSRAGAGGDGTAGPGRQRRLRLDGIDLVFRRGGIGSGPRAGADLCAPRADHFHRPATSHGIRRAAGNSGRQPGPSGADQRAEAPPRMAGLYRHAAQLHGDRNGGHAQGLGSALWRRGRDGHHDAGDFGRGPRSCRRSISWKTSSPTFRGRKSAFRSKPARSWAVSARARSSSRQSRSAPPAPAPELSRDILRRRRGAEKGRVGRGCDRGL